MHLYVFLKARTALSLGIMGSIILCVFMVFMVFAPMIVRMTERASNETLAVGLAYIGYMWMGAILIFFVTGLCTDVFRLLVYTSGALMSRNVSAVTSAHIIYFLVCLATSMFVIIYGSFEARKIVTEHVIIKTKKIPAEVGKLRIAQISDVHLGMIVGKERLGSIIRAVQQAKPDILVSTGDLLDGQPDRVDLLVNELKVIAAPYGKFAVTGNHEAYLDHTYRPGLSKELSEKAGFVLLSNEVVSLPGLITVAGIEDEAGRGWRHGDSDREASLCPNIDESLFAVLLKHRPVPYTGPLCSYDLQLSGHTHKGQIFPFFLITRFFFKQYAGFYQLNNNSYLYVNRGSGTWGPPIRFLAPPEVTIIDLVHGGH
jgi:predicted MPP superfamily phosphohydrolase